MICRMRRLPVSPQTSYSKHSAMNTARKAENSTSFVQMLANAQCAGYSPKNSMVSCAARLLTLRDTEAHTCENQSATSVIWMMLYSAAQRSK